MDNVRAPCRKAALGREPLFEGKVDRPDSGIGGAGNLADRGPGGGDNQPRAAASALARRQDRERAAFLWQVHENIEALRHGDRETTSGDGLHRIAVDRDHAPRQRAGIDPERARRGAVDQPQANATATFGGDHQRVIQRPIVDEIGVVVDVVEVHHSAHRHSAHRHAAHGAVVHAAHRHAAHGRAAAHGVHRAAAGQFGKHLLWVAKGEVMEKGDHLLNVGSEVVLGVRTTSGAAMSGLFLQTVVGMHPVGAAARHEIVAGGGRRSRSAGCPDRRRRPAGSAGSGRASG